jgi:DnaJ-class molecular chaperone
MDLIVLCSRCHGSGYDPDHKDSDGTPLICPKCDGAGKILTEDGKKLLEFLRFVTDTEMLSK